MVPLDLSTSHPSWRPLIKKALRKMNLEYINYLENYENWLPGPKRIFSAFSVPLAKTQYILFGESPYPRLKSAIGYAFWDGAVDNLWSENGFSKAVNRATSLRNILKMLLLAENFLNDDDISQVAITKIKKNNLVTTIDQLFNNFLKHGFLLLNASLVLSEKKPMEDAKIWRPFMNCLLRELTEQGKIPTLILFGGVAKLINTLDAAEKFPRLIAEHPYNISFIYNKDVLNFFRPLKLLHYEHYFLYSE